MAFSATAYTTTPIGGNIRLIWGTWSGAAGDAAGTVTFGGAYIGSLWFKNDASSNSSQIFPSVSSSTSALITTLTVQNQDNITSGTFMIFAGGQ